VALLGLGLAVVFSVLGLINFAHGELMTLTGYGIFYALALRLPYPVALLIGLTLATIAAILMERIAFRPVRNSSGISAPQGQSVHQLLNKEIHRQAQALGRPQICALEPAARAKLLRRPGHHHPAAGEHIGAVDNIERQLHVLLDQKRSDAA